MISNINIYEYPHAERIIVIGDIHGDLKRFKNILLDAKIINNHLEWIAEPSNSIVVQLGDQVDSLNRSPDVSSWEVIDDVEMIRFTNFLDNIAKAKGGRVISLIGNHEMMNTIGNFSYVSPQSLSDANSRYNLFKPKGVLASLLAQRPVVLKIGELFFCHAGLKKKHIELLKKHNKHISYINELWRSLIMNGQVQIEDKDIFDQLLLENDGILWTRDLDPPEITKSILGEIECALMFIGHNTMDSIKCWEGTTWFVDNGISRAYGNTSYQYLDIHNYKIQIKEITE